MNETAPLQPAKVAVFVLAMHRSGSSALTRALNLLQFDLGDPESLIPAKPDNPLGFWEQEPLQMLNDRMLQTLGRHWDTFAPLPEAGLVQLKKDFTGEMRETIREIFRGHPFVVWKDPRNLLLYDLWKAVWEEEGYQVKSILSLRHPAAVARSLHDRNRMPLLKGLAVWLAHHAQIMDLPDRDAVSVVDYDRLLGDWRGELRRCFDELDLPWPASLPGEELDRFLRADLRHHAPETPDAASLPFGFPVTAFYEALLAYGKGGAFPAELREALLQYRTGSLVLAEASEKAELACANLHQQQQDLTHAYRQLEDLHRSMEKAYAACRAELADIHAETEALRGHYRLETWALNLKTQLQDQTRRADDVSAELQRLRGSWYWRLGAPWRAGHRGIRLTCRLAGVTLHEFPAAIRLLRTEGPRSLCRQTLQRIRQERALSGGGDAPPATLSPPPSTPKQDQDHKDLFSKEQARLLADFLAGEELLDFHPATPAKVAVLLVLYNRAELTLACLRALQAHAGMPIELIIIDNASRDGTGRLLDRIHGATVIRNPENQHFLKACNQARDRVQSDYLLLLNNDAQLCEGALAAALGVFETEEKVGAVGGKILLLDGRLQEAGSILWQDGSCLGYGRCGNPNAPEYNFLREVDFCSGAFLLTPTRLFRELGGFDERFAPAYYEETDYCMRLRSRGFRILYQPKACITHFEFASSIRSSDAIDLHIRNQEIFTGIHAGALARQFSPSDGVGLLRARHAPPGGLRVLYIDDRVPHPALGSGYPRAQAIVNMLVHTGCLVTLVPLNFPHEDSFDSAHAVVSPRVEVMLGWGRADLGRLLASRSGYYDVIWVSRPDNMALVDHWLTAHPEYKQGLRVVYDAEAVFTLREKAKAELLGCPLTAAEFNAKLQKEVGLTRHADVIVSVSETEALAFRGNGSPAPNLLIRHALKPCPAAETFSERNGLLFVGNLQYDGTPNVDSVCWFVDQVWQSLKSRLPELELHVIGKIGADSLSCIKAGGVVIHGSVTDLGEWYRRCRLFVAPTRFSAGIPIKVLDAAAQGLPCVVTEGLRAQLGWKKDLEVGTAETLGTSFADQVYHYYTQEQAWNRLRNHALNRIRSEYSEEVILLTLQKILFP